MNDTIYTPGAFKASMQIFAAMVDETIFSKGIVTISRIAEIIDKETAAPEMLAFIEELMESNEPTRFEMLENQAPELVAKAKGKSS